MSFETYRPPDRSKYLVDSEISRLLKAAAQLGPFRQFFLCFMANTGLRPSEANQVRWRDVYMHQNRIRVQTIKQKNGRVVMRDVDITRSFVKALASFYVNYVKVSNTKGSDDRLFPRSRVALWKAFKRAAHLAGLPASYTLYSLRHSRCVYLLEWTGDLAYVSRQMGHSSVAVTSAYLHCLPSKRKSYVEKKLGTF